MVSSASTRRRPGSARLIAAMNASKSTLAELGRERLPQRLVPVRPERAAAGDQVLPRTALRLVQAERRRVREGAPLERRRDAVRVLAVPGLVHRRPEGIEPGRAIPRRQPNVVRRERGAEGMDGGIEPPRACQRIRRWPAPARRTHAGARARTTCPGTTPSTAGASRTSSVSTGRIVSKISATSVLSMNGSKSSSSGV